MNQVVTCQVISGSQNKVNEIEVEGADIYGEYIDWSLVTPEVGGAIQEIHVPSSLDSQEMQHDLQNAEEQKEYENNMKVNENVTKSIKNVVQTDMKGENVTQSITKSPKNAMEKDEDDANKFVVNKNEDYIRVVK